jgi:hypothetical protein
MWKIGVYEVLMINILKYYSEKYYKNEIVNKKLPINCNTTSYFFSL